MGIANDMMEALEDERTEVRRLKHALETIAALSLDDFEAHTAVRVLTQAQRIASVALGDQAYDPETFEVKDAL